MNDLNTSPRRAALPALVTAVAVAVLAAFVTLGGVAQTLNLAWGLWVTEALVFLGLPWVVLTWWGVDSRRMAGADTGSGKSAALGFALGALNYFAWAVPLMAAAQAFFPAKVVELFDSSALFKHQTPVETALLVAGVGVAAPVCEEFLFRGVLQRGLMERLQPSTAIVVTSLVFAAFHFDPVGFLARFEMGVLFGLLAWRSGSLWPSVAAHAANNLVSSALFFASGGDTEGALPLWVPLTSLAVGNALLFLVARLAEGRLAAPQPAEIMVGERRPLLRLLGGWAAAWLLSSAVIIALDARGASLGLFDAMHPVPHEHRKDARLWELRGKARAGEAPVEEYRAYRISLAADGGPPLAPDGGVGEPPLK
ncbi:MAG: type II CAAX endopeptidase family protein [Myxococcota bacterium]